MTVKEFILKIIALSVCGAVLIISMVAFKIDTYAADTTTVTITGEDLQALLMSGQWEATYTADGVNYNAMNIGSTIEQNSVVLISDISASGGSYSGSIFRLGSTVDYTNVIGFSISLAGGTNYTVNYGPLYQGIEKFDSVGGYLLGSSRIDLPTVNEATGQYGTVDIYNDITSTYDTYMLFYISKTFEPMNLREFIINCNSSFNLNSNQHTNITLNNIKTAITRIKITFANLSDTEVIKNQLKIANEYLEEITNSSSDDVLRIDDIEKEFSEVQDKAEEYNEVMDSVETPEAEEVIPEDSVADILDDENVSEGQPYIFSILESLQSITWILTMILISVVVGIIKYIIYGKS